MCPRENSLGSQERAERGTGLFRKQQSARARPPRRLRRGGRRRRGRNVFCSYWLDRKFTKRKKLISFGMIFIFIFMLRSADPTATARTARQLLLLPRWGRLGRTSRINC